MQISFRSIVIVHHAADRKLQRETKQTRTPLRRRAADRLRAAAARQAAREADRARRMSEAAVKHSDLENFDPDTPLEKLPWAREEMQRNF